MTPPQRRALAIVAAGRAVYCGGLPQALRRAGAPREDVFHRLHQCGFVQDTGESVLTSKTTLARVTPAGEKAAMRYDARRPAA